MRLSAILLFDTSSDRRRDRRRRDSVFLVAVIFTACTGGDAGRQVQADAETLVA
jgi:hypothetical protein